MYSFCIPLQPRLSFLTWIASSLPSGYLKSSVQTTVHPSTALSLNSLQPILVFTIEKLLLAGLRPREKPSGSCALSRKPFAQQRCGKKSCIASFETTAPHHTLQLVFHQPPPSLVGHSAHVYQKFLIPMIQPHPSTMKQCRKLTPRLSPK